MHIKLTFGGSIQLRVFLTTILIRSRLMQAFTWRFTDLFESLFQMINKFLFMLFQLLHINHHLLFFLQNILFYLFLSGLSPLMKLLLFLNIEWLLFLILHYQFLTKSILLYPFIFPFLNFFQLFLYLFPSRLLLLLLFDFLLLELLLFFKW